MNPQFTPRHLNTVAQYAESAFVVHDGVGMKHVEPESHFGPVAVSADVAGWQEDAEFRSRA